MVGLGMILILTNNLSSNSQLIRLLEPIYLLRVREASD